MSLLSYTRDVNGIETPYKPINQTAQDIAKADAARLWDINGAVSTPSTRYVLGPNRADGSTTYETVKDRLAGEEYARNNQLALQLSSVQPVQRSKPGDVNMGDNLGSGSNYRYTMQTLTKLGDPLPQSNNPNKNKSGLVSSSSASTAVPNTGVKQLFKLNGPLEEAAQQTSEASQAVKEAGITVISKVKQTAQKVISVDKYVALYRETQQRSAQAKKELARVKALANSERKIGLAATEAAEVATKNAAQKDELIKRMQEFLAKEQILHDQELEAQAKDEAVVEFQLGELIRENESVKSDINGLQALLVHQENVTAQQELAINKLNEQLVIAVDFINKNAQVTSEMNKEAQATAKREHAFWNDKVAGHKDQYEKMKITLQDEYNTLGVKLQTDFNNTKQELITKSQSDLVQMRAQLLEEFKKAAGQNSGELSVLRQQLSEVVKERDLYMNEWTKLGVGNANASDVITQIKVEIEKARVAAAVETKKTADAAAQSALAQAELDFQNSQIEVDRANQNITAGNAHYKELKEKYEKTKNDFDALVLKHNAAVRELSVMTDNWNTTKEELEAEIKKKEAAEAINLINADVNRQMQVLRTQVAQFSAEGTRLQGVEIVLNKTIAQQKEDLDSANIRVSELEREILRLQSELTQSVDSIQSLRNQIKEKDRQFSQAIANVPVAQSLPPLQSNGQLEARYKALEDEFNVLVAENGALDTEIGRLQNEISLAEERERELATRIQTTPSDGDDQDKNNQYKASISNLTAEYNRRRKEDDDKHKKDLKDKDDEYIQFKVLVQVRISELESTVGALNTEIVRLTAELVKLNGVQDELNNANRGIQSLQAHTKTQESHINALNSEKNRLEQEIGDLNTAILIAKSEVVTENNAKLLALARTQQLEVHVTGLEAQISALSTKRATTESSTVTDLRNKLNNTEIKLRQSQTDVSRLTQEIETTKKEIVKLQVSLNIATTEATALRTNSSGSGSGNNGSSNNNTNSDVALLQKDADIFKLQQRIIGLQSELDAARSSGSPNKNPGFNPFTPVTSVYNESPLVLSLRNQIEKLQNALKAKTHNSSLFNNVAPDYDSDIEVTSPVRNVRFSSEVDYSDSDEEDNTVVILSHNDPMQALLDYVSAASYIAMNYG